MLLCSFSLRVSILSSFVTSFSRRFSSDCDYYMCQSSAEPKSVSRISAQGFRSILPLGRLKNLERDRVTGPLPLQVSLLNNTV